MSIEESFCCCLYDSKRASYIATIYSVIYYATNCMINIFMLSQAKVSEEISAVMILYAILSLVCSTICLICSLLLVVALRLERKKMMLPWMIAVSIAVLVDVLFVVVNPSAIFDRALDFPSVCTILTDMFLWSSMIYAMMCVLMYYVQLITADTECNVAQQRQLVTNNVNFTSLNDASTLHQYSGDV